MKVMQKSVLQMMGNNMEWVSLCLCKALILQPSILDPRPPIDVVVGNGLRHRSVGCYLSAICHAHGAHAHEHGGSEARPGIAWPASHHNYMHGVRLSLMSQGGVHVNTTGVLHSAR